MDIYSKLYWLTRLDSIQGLFIGLTIIAFVTALAIIIWGFISSDFDEFYTKEHVEKRASLRKTIGNKVKCIIPLAFVFLILSVLIPTKKDVIFIIAGGKTIDWVQNDTSICKIPSQTTAIVSEFLENQLQKKNDIPKKSK